MQAQAHAKKPPPQKIFFYNGATPYVAKKPTSQPFTNLPPPPVFEGFQNAIPAP
jgi:hypothetical protein